MTPSIASRPSRAPRAVAMSNRAFGMAVVGARACLDGFWLGVLSERQIAALDEAYYSATANYTAGDYNRSGLWHWEEAAVEIHFRGVQHIVVTAAGGGREVLALARMGFRVTGYESHPGLAEFANRLLAEEDVPAVVHPCERDEWPAGVGEAGAVVVGWGAYMAIRGRARRVAFLRGAAQALPAGAPILLSFFARSGASRHMRVAVAVGNLFRPILHGERLVIGDVYRNVVAHFFDREEIAENLDAAGFDLVAFGPEATTTITDEQYGWAVGRRRDELPAPTTASSASTPRTVPARVRTVSRGLHPRSLRVLALAGLVEVGLRTMQLPRLAGLLGVSLAGETNPGGGHDRAMSGGRQCAVALHSVDRVFRRWPFGDTCLRRALVLGAMLRRRRPVLVIGVKRDETGATLAHAWLEIDGLSLDPSSVGYGAFQWVA